MTTGHAAGVGGGLYSAPDSVRSSASSARWAESELPGGSVAQRVPGGLDGLGGLGDPSAHDTSLDNDSQHVGADVRVGDATGAPVSSLVARMFPGVRDAEGRQRGKDRDKDRDSDRDRDSARRPATTGASRDRERERERERDREREKDGGREGKSGRDSRRRSDKSVGRRGTDSGRDRERRRRGSVDSRSSASSAGEGRASYRRDYGRGDKAGRHRAEEGRDRSGRSRGPASRSTHGAKGRGHGGDTGSEGALSYSIRVGS